MLIPPTYNTSVCAAPLLPDMDACIAKQMRLYCPLSPQLSAANHKPYP